MTGGGTASGLASRDQIMLNPLTGLCLRLSGLYPDWRARRLRGNPITVREEFSGEYRLAYRSRGSRSLD